MGRLGRIAEEPPLRLLSYFFIKRFSSSVRTKDRWGAVERPQYLAGVAAAANQARREGIRRISVLEFGVAGGRGLLELQKYAELVEAETGIEIRVFGFDTGEGLPQVSGYRDHPDQWSASDYRMDVPKLQQRLTARTSLVLGNIRDTIPRWLAEDHPCVGFVACDVDLYSSTVDVLRVLAAPQRKMLLRVPMYFDDVDFFFNHRFAGELLAIEEFNRTNPDVKIDRWRGVKKERVFREAPWLDKMFVAHDIAAIDKVGLTRPPSDGCALD